MSGGWQFFTVKMVLTNIGEKRHQSKYLVYISFLLICYCQVINGLFQ